MRRILIILAVLLAAPAFADDDQDRARDALSRGEILPFSRILAVIEREVDGRVIEIDLDRAGGRYVYEVEVLSPGGRLVELSLDAATGAVLDRDYEDE